MFNDRGLFQEGKERFGDEQLKKCKRVLIFLSKILFKQILSENMILQNQISYLEAELKRLQLSSESEKRRYFQFFLYYFHYKNHLNPNFS